MLKNRANKMLVEALSETLIRRGFRKQNSVYSRSVDRIAHMIDIQYSRWNNDKEVEFTLNCGVYVCGVTSSFRNTSEPSKPRPTDCCITSRIGMLTESKLDLWWKISIDTSAEEEAAIRDDIASTINRYALPFLDMFGDERSVAMFLSSPRNAQHEYVEPRADGLCLAYAAIIWRTTEVQDNCRTCIEQAVRQSKNTPLEGVIGAFASRFSC